MRVAERLSHWASNRGDNDGVLAAISVWSANRSVLAPATAALGLGLGLSGRVGGRAPKRRRRDSISKDWPRQLVGERASGFLGAKLLFLSVFLTIGCLVQISMISQFQKFRI